MRRRVQAIIVSVLGSCGCVSIQATAPPKVAPVTAPMVAPLPTTSVQTGFKEFRNVPGLRVPTTTMAAEQPATQVMIQTAANDPPKVCHEPPCIRPPTALTPPPDVAPPNRSHTDDSNARAGMASEMLVTTAGLRGPHPDSPLVGALRAHLEHRPAAAVDQLAGFDRPNQELLLLLLPTLAEARDTDLSGRDAKAAAQLAEQLGAASAVVRKAAPLVLRKVAFAASITQYGVYEPLPESYRYLPGALANVYVELDNVPSVPTGPDAYLTRLTTSLQVHDANGQVVEQFDPGYGRQVPLISIAQAAQTRSPVRDFFLKVEFAMPEKTGRYTLTLEVRDPANGRKVRKVVPFTIQG